MKREIGHAVFIIFMLLSASGYAATDTLRVACIGNSITEGANLSSPLAQSYPTRLNALLGETYQVKNYGVGGRVMLKNGDFPIWNEVKFSQSLEFDPDIVTIMLGTNDSKPFNWEDHKSEFVPDYIAMIDTFRSLDNNARFLLAYPTPAFSNLGSIRDSVIRNEIIPMIDEVAAVTGTRIVDLYHPMLDDSDLFPDGIHPNAAGHDTIAALFQKAVLTLPAAVDTLAPWFTMIPEPGFTVYDSAAALVQVKTAGPATVRYSLTDQPFDEMEFSFSHTGSREHSTIIQGEHGKLSTYYLRAMDTAGNKMDTSGVISFTFDTTKVLYTWIEHYYSDSSWADGIAPLGYGGTTTYQTSLSPVTTAYFRKKFTIENKESLVGIGILIKGHDGAVLYLNGHEVARINMPEKTEVDYVTLANGPMVLSKITVINAENGLNYLLNGENIVAVEMHVGNTATPVLAFDSQLFDNTNRIYYSLGSEWKYFDEGYRPENQLVDKNTQTAIHPPAAIIQKTALLQNYPNPFNPSTTIRYAIPKAEHVAIDIFDITGARVNRVIDKNMRAGWHTVSFDAPDLPSGFYFYRLTAGPSILVKRMLLLK